LESGAAAAASAASGRYDILPISSGETLKLGAGQCLQGAHAPGAHGFLDALDRWWSALRLPAIGQELPFQGGWLVYLGYEIAGEIEPTLKLAANEEPLAALAIRTPAAWVRDRTAMRAWLICEEGSEALLERFAQHASELAASPYADAIAPARTAGIAMQEDPPEKFRAAVRDALEYIAAGDVYQANLSRQWRGAAATVLDPVAIYRRLRETNPSPFAGLLRHADFAVLSSSPERLVSIRGDIVSTRPIAGTRPRGASADADAALIRTLLENEKERAEHVMLIDLERNDLGRVCVGGSVRVDEYMSVETYAHVHHIVSNVSGRKRPEVSPVQVIRAMFPGGTITGCPKVRCMQIISALESGARGAYTGSLGYLNRDGSCDFNILIRTITVQGNAVRFRAGAGIVADSDPEQELAETRAKAEGMLRAMRPAA
jgi:4-amino-4-deoxychorismate synthase (2-amino-4-deoxychorismate-forming) component I